MEKKSKDNYYMAASDEIHADGRLPICKACLREIVDDFNDVENLISIMRQIDRPFVRMHYEAAKANKNPFGEYMRLLGMRQHNGETYLDSKFDGEFEAHVPKTKNDLNKSKNIKENIKFKITPDIVIKWGDGFSDSELYQLESFYHAMDEANNIETPQHKESLKLLCKLNVLQNNALQNGKVNDFKNLNTQYNKILETSGLRPIDRKAGGESAGIRTFSQIWEEIEKDGFIEPYPYQEKQDIVDKTIMYMGNYTRKLVGMQSMSEPPEDTPKVDESDEG